MSILTKARSVYPFHVLPFTVAGAFVGSLFGLGVMSFSGGFWEKLLGHGAVYGAFLTACSAAGAIFLAEVKFQVDHQAALLAVEKQHSADLEGLHDELLTACRNEVLPFLQASRHKVPKSFDA